MRRRRVIHAGRPFPERPTSVSPTLDDQILHGPLSARANLGKFKAPIGSTDALGGEQSIDDNSAPPTLDQ
jgi:hypothetical protein